MYNNVLVPVALDHAPTAEAALKVARLLAGTDGKISALTVVEGIPPMVANELPAGMLEHQREATMEALKEHVGGDIEAHVVTGHAARTILDFAERIEADCIVIASHDPGIQDYFLGSTAARVVRHAHCAVHVVR